MPRRARTRRARRRPPGRERASAQPRRGPGPPAITKRLSHGFPGLAESHAPESLRPGAPSADSKPTPSRLLHATLKLLQRAPRRLTRKSPIWRLFPEVPEEGLEPRHADDDDVAQKGELFPSQVRAAPLTGLL